MDVTKETGCIYNSTELMQKEIDIYIPFATDSDSTELRYALRSVEANMTGVRDCYLITSSLPHWYRGCWELHGDDYTRPGRKEWNIINKIRNCARGTFLFMNDDHFIMSKHDATQFPNYAHGTLLSKRRDVANENPYRYTINNTMHRLGNQDQPYFDIHCPMVMDARQLRTMCLPDRNYGYCFKTMYAAHANLEPVMYADLKTDLSYIPEDRLWFSTVDRCDKTKLETLFPNKSRWEL